jgi:hypothetical protein
MIRYFRATGSTMLLSSVAILQIGCDAKIENHWKEEVRLGTGQVIWVQRETFWTQENQILGKSTTLLKLDRIRVVDHPLKMQTPFEESWDHPIRLDIDRNGRWAVVTVPASCQSWVSHGRSDMPYTQYLYDGNSWIKQAILSDEFLMAMSNLLVHRSEYPYQGSIVSMSEKENGQKTPLLRSMNSVDPDLYFKDCGASSRVKGVN